MFFSQTPQVCDILFPDDVPFFECNPFELTRSDFCDIMGQDFSHGPVNGDSVC
jgi:hypothetical protein